MKKTSAREIDRFTFQRLDLCAALVALSLVGGCRDRSSTRPAAEEQARAALEHAETIKCRELRARLLRAGAGPHALPELDGTSLPALGDDEAILSLRVEGGRMRRWLAQGSAVRELEWRELTALDRLLRKTRDELELGEELRGGSLDRLLAAAGGALLEGVSLGPLRRLLVLPDGTARTTPFAALLVDGQPLVVRAELAYAPCLGLHRAAASRWGPAEVLVPAYPGRPLEGVDAESRAVMSRFGAGGRARLGPAATPDALERALAEARGLVHFAGHAVADPRPGQAPELVFPGGQRPVTVGSATRRPVGAGLVVLGSCATAEVARFRDGQQLRVEVTLPEALLAAGARRVVAASWAVKDRQSALQMASFYRELEGRGPAAALALAQREARRGFEPPHPRFWAFYGVYGGW